MKYYVYEITPTSIITSFDGQDNEYIIEHTSMYNFITATDHIVKALKKVGAYPYPKQLKWDNGIAIVIVSIPDSSLWSFNKTIIICRSELAAEKFERQVLKNNLKFKRQGNDPLNNRTTINNYNAKQKEKRLLSTKYSK